MPKPVLVPPLGTTVDTVTFVSWYKQEGETVRRGEPLFVIETDKANLDVESPATGILRGATASEGDEFKALSVIAYITEEGEPARSISAPQPGEAANAQPVATVVTQPAPPALAVSTIPERRRSRVFISPRARKLAEANQAPIAEIKATGPEGAIIERDVRQWLVARVSAPAAMPALEQGQARLAERPAAGTLPAQRSTAAVEVNVTRLAAWCARLLENGAQPTYNSLILFILSRLSPDAFLQCKAQAAPGPVELALLIPAASGFRCVPVKETQRQGVAGLAAFERELGVLAASGNLPTAGARVLAVIDAGEYHLDTFTPGNIGSECAVLSLGRFRPHQDGDQVAWLSLAFDTGTVDDLQAAQFMRSLVPLIENPELLLGM